MENKESLSSIKFNWSKHDDAILEYDQFEMVMKTKMSKGDKPRTYLDDPALVDAAKKLVPVAVALPSDATLAAMSDKEVNVFKMRYEINREEIKAFTAANNLIETHFAQALADVEDCFTIKCNARKVVDSARVSAGASFEEKYRAVRAAVKREFEPSATLDAAKTRRAFETLTDRGRTFSEYHTEHKRLLALLITLNQKPTDSAIETAIIEYFKNPFFSEEVKHLLKDIAAHPVGTAAAPYPNGARTYTWENFLEECDACAASLPDVENWGTKNSISKGGDVGIKAGASIATGKGSYTSQGACFRCGLSGHTFRQCSSAKCSICNLQLGTRDENMTIQTLDHDTRTHSGGGGVKDQGGGSRAASKPKGQAKQSGGKPSYSKVSTEKLSALVAEVDLELKRRRDDADDSVDGEPTKKKKKAKARQAKAAAAISAIADSSGGSATG